MGEGPKQKITQVDVLVHPGFGVINFPFRFTLPAVWLDSYSSAIKAGHIDLKRFRKVLFGIWGGRIKEIARQKEKGLVIVPLDFSRKGGLRHPTLLGNEELIQASVRFIRFAKKEMGGRLVVINQLKYIEDEPERILKTYIKKGFMDEYTQPEFTVYGEESDVCVWHAKQGLDRIGRTKIDYSRTEELEDREKLRKKIVRRKDIRRFKAGRLKW